MNLIKCELILPPYKRQLKGKNCKQFMTELFLIAATTSDF